MSITGDQLKMMGGALFSQASATDQTRVNQALVTRWIHTTNIGDVATAGTAFTESVIAANLPAGRIKGVYVSCPIAVTANDTTYATLTVSKRTGAGAAVIVATQTTKITGGSCNIVAFVPVALTLSATDANLTIAASDVLTFLVSKASTGVALTAITSALGVSIQFEETT